MAPILSFTAEEIWALLPGTDRPASVFLAGFPAARCRATTRWRRAGSACSAVRTAVTKSLEEARQSGLIGHSLDARVQLSAADGLRRC